MKNSGFLILVILLATTFTTTSCSSREYDGTNQEVISWQQTYGTRFTDFAGEVIETNEGGFLITGYTESTVSFKNRGGALLIKLDNSGIIEWIDIRDDYPQSSGFGILQIQNGNFVIAGYAAIGSSSTGFDMDILVYEVDEKGSRIWERVIRGPLFEGGSYILQTSDAGYVIAGLSSEYNPTNREYVNQDFYLMKIDSKGLPIWQQTYGTPKKDVLHSIDKTDDGGFILAGVNAEESYLEENKYTRYLGKGMYIVKTDAKGNEQWSRLFGEDIQGYGYSVQQTKDGGFIVAGTSVVRGGKQTDIHLLKLDADGNEQWSQRHGGLEEDVARCIRQTDDGGYIIVGYSESFGAGDQDLIMLKTDTNGDIEWTQIYGGSERDRGASVKQTKDGGYIISGTTKSFGKGDYDVWVIKTDSLGEIGSSK